MRNVEYEKSDLAELHDVIVDYLQNNPNAADSLEGIMNYWLPQAYQKIDAARIEQVLEQLIDEGQVRKIILADRSILFRQGEP
jgi:hypothetical protein